jgi:hypothetical protein
MTQHRVRKHLPIRPHSAEEDLIIFANGFAVLQTQRLVTFAERQNRVRATLHQYLHNMPSVSSVRFEQGEGAAWSLDQVCNKVVPHSKIHVIQQLFQSWFLGFAEPTALVLNGLPNGWRYPLVGGTRQRRFAGTSFKPRKLPENAQTPTTMAPAHFAGDRVHAVLGGMNARLIDSGKAWD